MSGIAKRAVSLWRPHLEQTAQETWLGDGGSEFDDAFSTLASVAIFARCPKFFWAAGSVGAEGSLLRLSGIQSASRTRMWSSPPGTSLVSKGGINDCGRRTK